MIKFIVTGTIGSGKSTVMKHLKDAIPEYSHIKFDYYNIDDIVNDFYQDTEFQNILNGVFGTCDKKEISNIVFSGDKEKLDTLNYIVSNMLQPYFIEFANSNANLIIEVPYYFEMMLSDKSIVAATRGKFSVICVSMTSEEARIARIKERAKIKHPHWTDANIDTIIKSQLPAIIKEALADVIIFNDGSEDELKEKIFEFVVEHLDVVSNKVELDIDPENLLKFSRINHNILRVVDYILDTESMRYYHTTDHIANMIQWLMKHAYFGDLVTPSESLLLAILFHDIVYDPSKADNELKSVEAMKSVVEKFQPDLFEQIDIIDMAKFMILATIDHKVPTAYEFTKLANKYPYFLDELKLFLDLDLTIFIESRNNLIAYDDGIRSEYSDIPDGVYYPARIRILQNFYARDNIFMSSYFNTADNSADAKETIKYLIDRNTRKITEIHRNTQKFTEI